MSGVTAALSVVVAAAVGVSAWAIGASADAGSRPPAAPRSTFSVDLGAAFSAFPLLWLGREFSRHPLVAVVRHAARAAPAPGARPTDYVSFVYGDCDPRPHGCAPPLEVQVWNGCARRAGVASPLGGEHTPVVVRGARAFHVREGDGAHRLEIAAAGATVVIFGPSRDGVVAAAAVLRGLNFALDRDDAMPREVRRMPCT